MEYGFYSAAIWSIDLSRDMTNVAFGRVALGSGQAGEVVEDLFDRRGASFLAGEF